MKKMNFSSERELKASRIWQQSKTLIGFDTVSSNSNQACTDYVADELLQLGFNVIKTSEEGGKSQIIAHIGPLEEGGLVLSGHMDTVPFANQPGWSKDALELTLEDDKLYGRGTSDMKLFIPHCLEAFHGVDLKKLKKPIVCLFTCDEEVGCSGAKRMAPTLTEKLEGLPLPNMAVIGEPTHFEIINSHKGIVVFEILIHGKGGHSSRPDLGKNAIMISHKVMEATERLNKKYQDEASQLIRKLFPDYPYNHISLVQINGGLAYNMIPEECRLSFSYRALPGEDLLRLFKEIKAELDANDWGQACEIHEILTVPSLAPKNHKILVPVLQEVTGNREIKSVSFATDAAYFSQEDMACFVCGAGNIEMAHQPDEYMDLDEFLKGPDFIVQILNKTVF